MLDQRAMQLLQRLIAPGRVEVFDHAAHHPDLAHEAERIVGVGAAEPRLAHVLELHVDKTGRTEDRTHVLGIGEPERAGRARRRRRKIAPEPRARL